MVDMGFFHDPKFWVAVATVLFFILAYKPSKNAVNKMLDDKISKIEKDIADAKKLKSEALELLAIAEKKLSQVEEESKNILNHAKNQAENIIKTTSEKLEKDINIRKNMAVSKIKNFEDEAISEIKSRISTVTLLATHTIIEQNIDDEKVAEINNISIDKISKTFH
jgi:F-type H+-transporting ATPase subunit b